MTIPAVRVHRFNDPETLEVDQIDAPVPQVGEVLARVVVASVNPIDWKMAEGHVPTLDEDSLPLMLGRDFAGEVLTPGPDMDDWPHDTRICAFLEQDNAAQAGRIIVRASELVRIPDMVPTETAGALPLAAMTAWQGLFNHGGLAAGQRVLIHGGAGGVGHLAVQFAKLHGAHVFATVSDRDLDFVRAMGADTAIDYEKERFEEVAGDLDLVFDTQGGEVQKRSFATLKPGGLLVSTIDVDEAAAAEAGVRVAPRWHAKPDTGMLSHILELVNDGKVEVEIAARYRLEEVAAAHRFARTKHPRGKVILVY